MDLPPNYPHNARPYDLAAQAAKKGKALMEAAQSQKLEAKQSIGFKLKTTKGRQIFANEIVEYMMKQKVKHDDERARERRYGAALLPGFEDLAEMRTETMKAHLVQKVGGWVKGDVSLEKSRSANVRATINAGRRGDDAAKLIAKLKVEREAANKKLREEVASAAAGKRTQRKSRLTWGKDETNVDLEESDKPKRNGARRTFSKMAGGMFGGSKKVIDEDDAVEDSSIPVIVPKGSVPPALAHQSKLGSKKKSGMGSMFGFFATPATKHRTITAEAEQLVDVGPVPLAEDDIIDKVAGLAAATVQAQQALEGDAPGSADQAPSTASTSALKPSKYSTSTPATAADATFCAPPSPTHGAKHKHGELPVRTVHLLSGVNAKLSKAQIAHVLEQGGGGLRRNDFVELPGFEHGHHLHKHKHLMNFDNDLLCAEQQNGLIRTFLHDSAREYDGHAASINQVCFSHDERRVASCSSDKTIKLWDPLDGNMVNTLYGHADEVMGVNFSNDGFFLVSCSVDNLVIVWNLTNGKVMKKLFGHYDAVYRCCFTHSANSLMSSSCDMTIKSWNLTPNVPDPPARPIMSDVTTTKCLITWTPPPGYNEEITAYFIEYRIGHRGDFGDTISISGFDRRRKITGLLPGTAYQFRIRAMNRMGKGAWSEPSPQVITEFGVPQKLERPEVENASTNSVTVSWWAPVPSVKGSAIQNFHIQLSGYGVDFGEGATWHSSWTDCRESTKAWEIEKARKERLDAEGKDDDGGKPKSKLKEGMNKMMMALRAKRDTRDSKTEHRKSISERKSRATRGTGGLTALMADVFGEAKKEVEDGEEGEWEDIEEWLKLDEVKGNVVGLEFRVMAGKERLAEMDVGCAGTVVELTTKIWAVVKVGDKERKVRASCIEVKKGAGVEKKKVKKKKGEEGEAKKKPAVVGWMEKARERKKEFILQEVARTKRHLADQKERKKRKEQIKREKREGRVKQKRKEKKYHKSEMLKQQLDEADKKHKKLFAQMTFTATGLSPGIMYRVRVAAVNNTGEGPFSVGCFSTFTLSQCPEKGDPPHQLSHELDSMMIEWTTPHDNGAAITAFCLRQCYDGVEHEFKRTVQRIVVGGLEAGKGYKFQVKSANSEGWSEWSKESAPLMTMTREPDVPEKPVVTGKSPVSVSFKVMRPAENGDEIHQYIVRKREMSVKRKTAWGPAGVFVCGDGENLEKEELVDDPLPPHAKVLKKFAHITVAGLSPGSHYDFQVACKNGSGTSQYGASSYRTKTNPAQRPDCAKKVWCTNVGPTSLFLNWAEPANNGSRVLGYNVEEMGRERETQKEIDEHEEKYSVGCVTRKRVDALESSFSYRFRVQARNSAGLSDWSKWSKRVESVQKDPSRLEGGTGAKAATGMDKFGIAGGLAGVDDGGSSSEGEEGED